MKRVKRKRFFAMMLSVIMAVSCLFVGCGCYHIQKDKIEEFYETVVYSKGCLDVVAGYIYICWYDAIYEDKYEGSIDSAVICALEDNAENLKIIKDNDAIIKELYKKLMHSIFELDFLLEQEIKNVMSVYLDYYEFVVNVSGSFESFSASKVTLKKELASALKDLQLEM